MNSIPLFSLILLFSVLGCGKSDTAMSADHENNTNVKTNTAEFIIGKWNYVENYFSIGGPGQWHTVVPAGQTIEFKADGSFIPAESFLKGMNRYGFVDSVTIKFHAASTPSDTIWMGYSIRNAERELYLYPVNPMCIEGCNNKFRR